MAGRVWAIRVQDIARGLWFNWDRGSWVGAPPSCTPGTNSLYVAFWVINEPVYINGQYHTDLLTLVLRDGAGNVLASKSVYVSSDPDTGGAGLEWTGRMPSTGYTLSCVVTP